MLVSQIDNIHCAIISIKRLHYKLAKVAVDFENIKHKLMQELVQPIMIPVIKESSLEKKTIEDLINLV